MTEKATETKTRIGRRPCRHYTGGLGSCAKGREYFEVCRQKELGTTGCLRRLPCQGEEPGRETGYGVVQECPDYEPLSAEEVEAGRRRRARIEAMLRNKLSACCGAPLEESQVIKDGPRAGHGPRFCSKCKELQFWV